MSNQIMNLPSQDTALDFAPSEHMSKNPAAVYILGLKSQESRRSMAGALNQIAAMLGYNPIQPDFGAAPIKRKNDTTYLDVPWQELRYAHVKALIADLTIKYQPSTANKLLAALKGVLKECWRLELMSAEDYRRAIDFKGVKGKSLPAGRDLSSGEIMALSNACAADLTAAGARDAALIAVLSIGGLRRAELVALDRADLDAESGKMIVRHGKGDKARTSYLTNGALEAVRDWLDVRGDEPGALFLPIHKAGNIQKLYTVPANESESPKLKGMTAQAIFNMLVKRGKEAGVKDFSPHDFRRTFAGDMLDAGVDISLVSKLMGHSSVETTGRYDRRPEEMKKQAAAKLHFPHKKRQKLV